MLPARGHYRSTVIYPTCSTHFLSFFGTKNSMKFLRNLKSNSKTLQNTNFWKIWQTWPISLKLLSSTTWMKDTRDSWFTLTLVSSVSLSIHTSGSPYMITTLLVSIVARERMKCLHIFSPSLTMLILTCWETDITNLCWLLVSKMINRPILSKTAISGYRIYEISNLWII